MRSFINSIYRVSIYMLELENNRTPYKKCKNNIYMSPLVFQLYFPDTKSENLHGNFYFLNSWKKISRAISCQLIFFWYEIKISFFLFIEKFCSNWRIDYSRKRYLFFDWKFVIFCSNNIQNKYRIRSLIHEYAILHFYIHISNINNFSYNLKN